MAFRVAPTTTLISFVIVFVGECRQAVHKTLMPFDGHFVRYPWTLSCALRFRSFLFSPEARYAAVGVDDPTALSATGRLTFCGGPPRSIERASQKPLRSHC
jgi:hypothetical protein